MSNKLAAVLVVLDVAGAGAWYAFRPERLFINQKVNEQFPTASAASNKLASGQFHNGAHETKGTASVFQLADGKKTLRLTDFATSNGPDVHVYLVAAADASGRCRWSDLGEPARVLSTLAHIGVQQKWPCRQVKNRNHHESNRC